MKKEVSLDHLVPPYEGDLTKKRMVNTTFSKILPNSSSTPPLSFKAMNEHFDFADGGESGNPPFSPPSFPGRKNMILSISKGDLVVPTSHFNKYRCGLRYECPITGLDLFRLVPCFHSLQFNYLGDPLCNAMDSVIRVLLASVP